MDKSNKRSYSQGRFLELLNIEESHITWRSMIFNLPRGVLKFAVNASIDTLPTNANLKRWGKRSTSTCKCGRIETLHHVLNNCSDMLERYSWRHDSILRAIVSRIEISRDIEMFADLPTHMAGISTIPADILVTSLRPDMIILNRVEKNMTIFELSVPFETNILATHSRKQEKYEKLVMDIENLGYKVQYYAFEIGSRGYLSNDNIARIKSILRKYGKKSKFSSFKSTLVKISLISSFVIYHSKFEENWVRPALVSI